MRAKTFARKAQEHFPGITGIEVRPEYGKTAVLLGNAAEGGVIGEMPAAEYYPEWQVGAYVNPALEAFAEQHGFLLEWQDPGTLIAYSLS